MVEYVFLYLLKGTNGALIELLLAYVLWLLI